MITKQHAQNNVANFKKRVVEKELHTLETKISDQVNQKSAMGYTYIVINVEYFEKETLKSLVDKTEKAGYTVKWEEYEDSSKAGKMATLTVSWN